MGTAKTGRKLVFFGGNRRNEDGPLLNLSLEALNRGNRVTILTDDFHWNLPTGNGQSLGARLESIKIKGLEWIVAQDLSPNYISKVVENGAVGLSLNSIWIIKKEIASLFDGHLYNYHNAKLPRERGAAIYSWKILSQNKKGALTIHKITPEIDAGEIVKEKEIIFPDQCRIPIDFYRYMKKYEMSFLLEFIEGKDLVSIKQDEKISTYMPRLHTLTHGLINWDWSAKEIEVFINAFDDPHEGASTFSNSKKLHLKKCFPAEESVNFHPFQAGLVYRKNSRSLFVAAKDSGLEIREILDSLGNNILSQFKLGQRLYTPSDLLENTRDHLNLPGWSKWWV